VAISFGLARGPPAVERRPSLAFIASRRPPRRRHQRLAYPETPVEARIRALVMAADHERLNVIDALIAAGTPVDAVDATHGRQPLRTAAANGRTASVRRLLAHGADPKLRDVGNNRTVLDWCRHNHAVTGHSPAHEEVEAILIESNDIKSEVDRDG
jgi:ankyrin repeat protein